MLKLTTLTASTPEALNWETEEFVKGLDKVVRVDRSGFPEEVRVWYVDKSINKD